MSVDELGYPRPSRPEVTVGWPNCEGVHWMLDRPGGTVSLVRVRLLVEDVSTGDDISQQRRDTDAMCVFLWACPPDMQDSSWDGDAEELREIALHRPKKSDPGDTVKA